MLHITRSFFFILHELSIFNSTDTGCMASGLTKTLVRPHVRRILYTRINIPSQILIYISNAFNYVAHRF